MYLITDMLCNIFDAIELPLTLLATAIAIVLAGIAIFIMPTLLFIGVMPLLQWIGCVFLCFTCFAACMVFVVTRTLLF